MKLLKKAAALCLAAAMVVSITACGSKTKSVADIQKSGKIVMATNAEFEPFEYKSQDKIVGIDVDIAQKAADKLGVKLEVTDLAFDSLITAMQSGKADFVAAGMTVTEDRLKNVDFTDTYFNASQAIIVLKGSAVKNPEDLKGKKVGVQLGTTGDTYCTDEGGKNGVGVQEVKRFNKGMEAVSDLIAGRIDAVVIDNFPADKFVEKNADKIEKLDKPLTSEEYAIAVPKGNEELKNKLNELLKEMKDSGEMDKIVGQYISAE